MILHLNRAPGQKLIGLSGTVHKLGILLGTRTPTVAKHSTGQHARVGRFRQLGVIEWVTVFLLNRRDQVRNLLQNRAFHFWCVDAHFLEAAIYEFDQRVGFRPLQRDHTWTLNFVRACFLAVDSDYNCIDQIHVYEIME